MGTSINSWSRCSQPSTRIPMPQLQPEFNNHVLTTRTLVSTSVKATLHLKLLCTVSATWVLNNSSEGLPLLEEYARGWVLAMKHRGPGLEYLCAWLSALRAVFRIFNQEGGCYILS